MLNLTSPAFEDGEAIPREHSGEGLGSSPELRWSGSPEETSEFALLVEDPDAPGPSPWVHWVVYNIPPTVDSLPEGSAAGATEGRATSGETGYVGPMPPRGNGMHSYRFVLFALDEGVNLGPGASREELLAAVEGHVLDEAELVGTYER